MSVLKIIKNKKGIAAIEFAMLFLPFFLFIAAIIESLLMAYKISVIDYLTDSLAKKTVTLDSNYFLAFKNNLEEKGEKLLVDFNDENTLITINYCNSLDEILLESCSGNPEKFKIAQFFVTYKLDPMFLGLRIIPSFESIKSTAIYTKEDLQ